MRDLLTDPLWRPEDLGRPLPDSPHACSVCLPTWASVIGYEENDPAVTGRMQAGYPRFFCHPQVTALFSRVRALSPSGTQRALVLPTEAACVGLADFVRSRHPGPVTVVPFGPVMVALFDEDAEKTARLFWRYCGQIVSSRLAAAVMAECSADEFVEAERAGEEARTTIRRRLSALSGQPPENIFLFASGMAATFGVHQAFTALKPGARTVQLGFPYVDALKIQQEFGAGVHLLPGVGTTELSHLAGLAAREPLAGVFCEIPSNPLIETADIARLAALAHAHGLPVAADDTVATVVNIDALAHADVVTTSLTKAFSGVGDVMAGAAIVNDRSRWRAPLRATLAAHERAAPLFGPDAVVLERNSRDFPERASRMSNTAAVIAEFLAAHPAIARVHYPTVAGRTEYDALRRPGAGYGMLLSLTLKDPDLTPAFFDRLEISKGPSLGTNFSLACPYTQLAHYPELDWAESCGVSRYLIRISIGLEPPDDLVHRLQAALD